MNVNAQDEMLCQGKHWAEDQANLMMKKFSGEWNDLPSWEKRAGMIKQGIIKGMKLDQMPEIDGAFNVIIRNTRTMDGYVVENIAFESFPVFYVTGNLYRPEKPREKNAAILCPYGGVSEIVSKISNKQ